MVVLQDTVGLERYIPGPHCETHPTSSHDADQAISSIKVEEVSGVQREEEDPVPVSCEAIKAELEVRCVSVCPLLGRFHTQSELPVVSLACVSVHAKQHYTSKWVLKRPFSHVSRGLRVVYCWHSL
jgi:hypothetical protein